MVCVAAGSNKSTEITTAPNSAKKVPGAACGNVRLAPFHFAPSSPAFVVDSKAKKPIAEKTKQHAHYDNNDSMGYHVSKVRSTTHMSADFSTIVRHYSVYAAATLRRLTLRSEGGS